MLTDVRVPVTATRLDVVHLLIAGAHREEIACALHMSARTLDSRLADLKLALNAPDRFCLGVRAVRVGWVEPEYPIARACARRACSEWIEPTERQRELLHLRADGASIEEVAVRLGTSRRTVHRHLSQLANENGAPTAATAGALFTALRWT